MAIDTNGISFMRGACRPIDDKLLNELDEELSRRAVQRDDLPAALRAMNRIAVRREFPNPLPR